MVELNVVNFVTIGLIAVAFVALLRYALNMLGYSPSWL